MALSFGSGEEILSSKINSLCSDDSSAVSSPRSMGNGINRKEHSWLFKGVLTVPDTFRRAITLSPLNIPGCCLNQIGVFGVNRLNGEMHTYVQSIVVAVALNEPRKGDRYVVQCTLYSYSFLLGLTVWLLGLTSLSIDYCTLVVVNSARHQWLPDWVSVAYPSPAIRARVPGGQL